MEPDSPPLSLSPSPSPSPSPSSFSKSKGKTPKKRYKNNNGEQEVKNTWTSDEEYTNTAMQLKYSKDHKTPKIYKPTNTVSMYTNHFDADEELTKSTERMRRLSIDEDYRPNFALASDMMNSFPQVNSTLSFDQRPLEQWTQSYGENNSHSSKYTKEEIMQDIQARVKDPNVKAINKRNIPSQKEYFEKDFADEDFGKPPSEYKLYRHLGLYDFYSRMESICQKGWKTTAQQKKIDWIESEQEKVDPLYCADFLRESRPEFGERDCRYGKRCIFMILGVLYPDTIGDLNDSVSSSSSSSSSSSNAFIAREYLRPFELKLWKESHMLPKNVRMCLGCNRLRTTFIFDQNEIKGIIPHTEIQDHAYQVSNHYSQSDRSTYNISNCLVPAKEGKWNGIVAPFVRFNANNYVFTRVEKPASPYTTNTREYKCVVEKNLNFQ